MQFSQEYVEKVHLSRSYIRELKTFSMRDHKTKRQLAILLRQKKFISAETPQKEQRQLDFAWQYLTNVVEEQK